MLAAYIYIFLGDLKRNIEPIYKTSITILTERYRERDTLAYFKELKKLR